MTELIHAMARGIVTDGAAQDVPEAADAPGEVPAGTATLTEIRENMLPEAQDA